MDSQPDGLLQGPYEILELDHLAITTITPTGYESGLMDIQPKYAPRGTTKRIKVLRLFYDKPSDQAGVNWWDITSSTLIAQVQPMIEAVIQQHKSIAIKAEGQAPRKRFTVRVI
jgi:hypothetical protein